MKFRLYSLFIVLVVAGTVGAIATLEANKSRLRRQITELREKETSLATLRAESTRNQMLLNRFKTSADEGAKAIHADLVAARAELTALEAKAGRAPADASVTPSIEANRDPAKAMTKLEALSEAGRATPEAALQTLIWAAMKGREPEMAACVSLDPAARAKAESLLATLPEEVRSKYGTPEQLVGLVFSRRVLEATAFQFLRSSFDDAEHANLAVRIRSNGRDHETKIPMVRSADGWSMAVAEKQIDAIRRDLTAESPPQ